MGDKIRLSALYTPSLVCVSVLVVLVVLITAFNITSATIKATVRKVKTSDESAFATAQYALVCADVLVVLAVLLTAVFFLPPTTT